jgi:hypothetical protein
VARLIVAGPRAVARLASVVRDDSVPPLARSAALRALEASESLLALEAARRAVDDRDTSVAEAAIGVLRGFLGGPHGVSVIDQLASVVLERDRPDSVRVGAFTALGDLQPATLGPLAAALADDPSPALKALAAPRRDAGRATGPLALLKEAAGGALPDDPAALRLALGRMAGRLSLPDLAAIVGAVRDRERLSSPAQRPAWMAARASVHSALAHRGSRLALYDLRETLEGASGPLPVEFIATLVEIGDAACLEAIAAAHVRATSTEGEGGWWRRHLADAFQVIATRERITRRHAVIRRIEKRWPASLGDLWSGKRPQ